MGNYSIEKGVLVVEDGVTKLPRNPYANGFIGKGYFQDELDIIEVKLPSTLKSIGDWAFLGCKNLKTIEIPNSVTQIENLVFSKCESLEEIVVPDSVSKMQDRVFENCKKLKKVKLSKKIKNIPLKTFSGCESLEEVWFSDNLNSFESNCFYGCKNLKELHIPKKVSNIEYDAFEGCSGLERITVDEANETFRSVAGSNAVLKGTQLVLGCKNTVIPEGTTVIGALAFSGCAELKSISIPEGVTEIRTGAFSNCSSLEEIYLPSTLEKIGDECFVGCYKLSRIYVDKKNKTISSGKEDKVLISDNRLLYFVGTDIPADEDFEEIDKDAFNKLGMTELIIPEGVKRFGKLNFYREESTRVDELGVEQIEYKAFPLRKLSIPSTVEEIDADFFPYLSNWAIKDIDEIEVSEKNKYYDSRNNCNAIIDSKNNTLILACKNTVIPEGVVSVNCRLISENGVKNLTIPKSVKQIEKLMGQIDEMVILGDAIDPLNTEDLKVKRICASKTIIEILKKDFENRSAFRNLFNSSSKGSDEGTIEFVEL